MIELLKVAVLFLVLFVIMFCLGSYVLLMDRKARYSTGSVLVFGFLIYFFGFEIFALPLMLMKQPLNVLSVLWTVTVICLTLFSCVKFSRYWKKIWHGRRHVRYSFSFFLMFLLILAQCIFVVFWTDNSADAAYYVANVSANVATNTINIYEPFTGELQDAFYLRYLFGLYPVHNSVVCQVTGIHPLLLTKTVMSVFTVVFSYLLYAEIGKKLFPEKPENIWRMICFLSLIQFFFHTTYSNASFLLTRGYEGKAILANIIVPAVLYLGLCLYENTNDRVVWSMLFLAAVAGVNISMSGMSIIPVAESAVILPVIICHKKWRKLINYGICLVPSVVILVVYIMGSRGYFSFEI